MNSTADVTGALPPLPPHIVAKTGPRLLGYLLHWGLFGVLNTQVYVYYLSFPRDPRIAKLFVYSTYIIEVVQTIIITKTAWHVFAVGYGEYSFYDQVEMGWFNIPLVSGTVALIAQMFYAYRIFLLARSYWMPSLIMVLALFQFSGALASAIILKRAAFFSHLVVREYAITAAIWNGGSALCDIIIAVCMVYHLSRSRSKHNLRSTQVLLRRLITVVIETGMVTAAIASINLALSLLPNHIMYYMATSEIMAKIYSNSMLVLLNSRINFSPVEDYYPDMGGFKQGSSESFRSVPKDAIHFPVTNGITVTREEMVFTTADRPSDCEDEFGRPSFPSKAYLRKATIISNNQDR